MKKVVICASNTFYEDAEKWKPKLENLGYKVIKSVEKLDNNSIENYSVSHESHYKKILDCDILFILNLEKNQIKNYIGPSVFAEIAFAIGLNLSLKKKIKIYCLNPIPLNLSYSTELNLWYNLGWISSWKS